MDFISRDAWLRKQLEKDEWITVQPCTPEENEQYLAMKSAGENPPNGVFQIQEYGAPATFNKVVPSDLTDSDELALIELLRLKKVSAIKNWVTYFGVLSVCGLIYGLITAITLLSR